MKNIITSIFLITCIVTTSSCMSQSKQLSGESATKPNSDYTYTAKIIEGQVYLQLNTNPSSSGRIGPFVKQSDGKYICRTNCKTEDKGVHSLSKSPNSEWLYSWSYIHMCAQRVDASILNNEKTTP